MTISFDKTPDEIDYFRNLVFSNKDILNVSKIIYDQIYIKYPKFFDDVANKKKRDNFIINPTSKNSKLFSIRPAIQSTLKYELKTMKYIRRAILHIRNLRSYYNEKTKILDIGSGPCIFLLINKLMGYECHGLDHPEAHYFIKRSKVFNVNLILKTIAPFKKLNLHEKNFTIIFSSEITFNGHLEDYYWSKKEWEFFISDLKNYASNDVIFYFSFHPQVSYKLYLKNIRDSYSKHPTEVFKNKYIKLRRNGALIIWALIIAFKDSIIFFIKISINKRYLQVSKTTKNYFKKLNIMFSIHSKH